MQFVEDQCPICKSESYLNPSMRLVVSTLCGHKYCDTCIKQHFIKLDTLTCHICKTVLKRTSFTADTIDGDRMLDKDTKVRKKILRDFNKRREDFSNLREYNDYLEMVEDISKRTMTVHQGRLQKTTTLIEDYKRKNAASISLNQAKLAEEERQMREERERREPSLQRKEDGAAVPAIPTAMNSTLNPAAPKGPSYQPSMQPAAGAAAQPQPLAMPKRDADALAEDKQHQENARRAGGYADGLPKKRALEEFFSSLTIIPKKQVS